jgi:hypothetical protein
MGVGHVYERAFGRGEDEAFIAPEVAHLRPLLQLSLTVTPEGFYSGRGKPDASAALVGLGLAERELVLGPGELLVHPRKLRKGTGADTRLRAPSTVGVRGRSQATKCGVRKIRPCIDRSNSPGYSRSRDRLCEDCILY